MSCLCKRRCRYGYLHIYTHIQRETNLDRKYICMCIYRFNNANFVAPVVEKGELGERNFLSRFSSSRLRRFVLRIDTTTSNHVLRSCQNAPFVFLFPIKTEREPLYTSRVLQKGRKNLRRFVRFALQPNGRALELFCLTVSGSNSRCASQLWEAQDGLFYTTGF